MKINLLITKLQNLENLSSTETTFLFTEIFSGKVCENELEKILKFLAEKGETVQEISAAAKVMKNFAIPVEISGKSGKKVEIFDVCGTGGSGNAKTFNLSTTVAFVMAAGGVKTAKHGNRKASSQSGSADVLEALNIEISLDPKKMQENLETKNMSFLFAQVLHPAMKYVMPVRKKLAIRTIFNFMGPLTNPAHTQKQLVGVSEKSLVLPMAQILKKLGKKSAMVVYGEDGLDEITLTGKTYYAKFLENPENSNSSEIITGEISPEDFGFKTVSHSEISGGNPEKNAEIILGIFSGNPEFSGPKKDILLLNAGFGFYIAGKTASPEEGIQLAREIIDSGKALELLKSFQKS